jgi:hypothetical protein
MVRIGDQDGSDDGDRARRRCLLVAKLSCERLVDAMHNSVVAKLIQHNHIVCFLPYFVIMHLFIRRLATYKK